MRKSVKHRRGFKLPKKLRRLKLGGVLRGVSGLIPGGGTALRAYDAMQRVKKARGFRGIAEGLGEF